MLNFKNKKIFKYICQVAYDSRRQSDWNKFFAVKLFKGGGHSVVPCPKTQQAILPIFYAEM